MLDRESYLDRWAQLHGGYDPRGSVLVGRWLAGTYVVARPLAGAGVPPDLVTLAGPTLSAAATAPAAAGGPWLLLAALVVGVSGVLDNLDGAVAILSGRTTRWGHLVDSLADRGSDVLYLVVLALAGAPLPGCVLGGTLMFLQEYARARAAASGMTDVGVVTVWERPTRVAVTALFLVAAALLGEVWVRLAAWAWVGLGLVGLAQLLVVVRRRLR